MNSRLMYKILLSIQAAGSLRWPKVRQLLQTLQVCIPLAPHVLLMAGETCQTSASPGCRLFGSKGQDLAAMADNCPPAMVAAAKDGSSAVAGAPQRPSVP